ncbi:MAG TPA: GspH/FimT family pseudopilin [Ideonella sp.]|nr:GspH/FimT family pseudopilin [Ideonella sp.]HJV70793.1 GspH/FimT family pseudopilin [Ideonella sp.]
MLITLAIAGILLAIGVPAMTSFLAMRSSVANAEELVEALRFARSEAIKRSSQVTVCSTTEPDAADPSCGGTGDWISGWVVKHTASGRVLRVQNVVRAMKQINTSEDTVSFEATGIASSGATTFEFVPIGEEVDDRVRTVELSAQGRVQLLKGRAPA